MSDQFFPTTRLSNVIKLIMLGNQTGLLQVMRGSGGAREEGQVQFVDGRIELAAIGHLTGQAALSVLQTWGEATYQFLDGVNQLPPTWISHPLIWSGIRESAAQPPPGSGSFPNTSGSNPGMGSAPLYSSTPSQSTLNNSNPGNGSNPGMAASQPGLGNFAGMPPGPGTSFPPVPPPGPMYPPLTGYPSAAGPPRGPAYPPGTGGFPPGPLTGGFPASPLPPPPRPAQTGQLGGAAPGSGMMPVTGTGALKAAGYVPRRLVQFDNGASIALERRERQMLLLIDGRRTVHDLVLLTRRSEEEVQAILAHLITMSLAT